MLRHRKITTKTRARPETEKLHEHALHPTKPGRWWTGLGELSARSERLHERGRQLYSTNERRLCQEYIPWYPWGGERERSLACGFDGGRSESSNPPGIGISFKSKSSSSSPPPSPSSSSPPSGPTPRSALCLLAFSRMTRSSSR